MARTKGAASPDDGSEYHVVACPWCGYPAPLFSDRKGNPYTRCTHCACRSFGTRASLELAIANGRAVPVTWPPTALQPGLAFG